MERTYTVDELLGAVKRVTGFDLSSRAIRWAKARFPALEFIAADLFAPPTEWNGAFDLVHE